MINVNQPIKELCRIYVHNLGKNIKTFVTQPELMRLFEGDIKTDISNST